MDPGDKSKESPSPSEAPVAAPEAQLLSSPKETTTAAEAGTITEGTEAPTVSQAQTAGENSRATDPETSSTTRPEHPATTAPPVEPTAGFEGATEDSVSDDAGRALVPDSFDGSDTDSAVGISDEQLSTSSLRSSIYNYHLENGRTYHALSKGKYMLPNDDDENERLDIQNQQFRLTFEGHTCFAPGAKTAERVLDVGTGTGIWAIDFADDHPNAQVLGVDLSPIQPAFVPPNCIFEIDDLEKEWTWTEPFDYIFCRMMAGSFANWGSFLNSAYDNLAPGGWMELIDNGFPVQADDDTLTKEDPIYQWTVYLIEASNKLGRQLDTAKGHKQRLLDAGFTNVHEKIFKWPINTWPRDRKHKEIGLWTLANVDGGLEGLSLFLFTNGLGWSKEEVLAFLVGVRKDLRNPRIHAYFPIHVAYGQKPGPM